MCASWYGFSLRRATVAASLLLAFFGYGALALAGVTGDITGIVRAANGGPLAGVEIRAVSPSMNRSATTDVTGHFVILALAPDTYTIYLHRSGYEDASFPGVTVFADQTKAAAYTMRKALRTIARVSSAPAASLVNPGVGIDMYSVNAAQVAAAAPLGGPGNLNNAYSAMATVPGVQVSQGGVGWAFNAVYVRGQQSTYTGYEYDGVPVNRAFDNYNGSTEPSLGLQELQVYTGGGPPSVVTAGTAGFINEVIKTGTFPGYATANLSIGSPTYYHQAQVEIGGSTPDRTFSYYVGSMGYNQTYRIIDNSNGAAYSTPGGIFSGNAQGQGVGYGYGSNQYYDVAYTCIFGTCQGVKPMCPLYGAKFRFPDQGCWQFYSGTANNPLMVSDRENVVNLHLGIPRANGLRDDVQMLFSASALNNYGYNSPNDAGPGVNQLVYSLYNTKYAPPVCGNEPLALWGAAVVLSGYGCTSPPGSAEQIYSFLQLHQLYFERYGQYYGYGPPPYHCTAYPIACAPTYVGYADNVVYNLPFGTPIASSATNFKAPSPYFAPGTPPHPFAGPLPLNDDSIDVEQNDTGIAKLQYTHALGQSAYLRAYGYTFYSDDFLTDPTAAGTFNLVGTFPGSAQYQVLGHTTGGALEFEDQVSAQHLISIDGNYTTSGVLRLNNGTAYGGVSPTGIGNPPAGAPIGYMAKTLNGYTCYDPSSGAQVPCVSSGYYNVATQKTVQYPLWVGGTITGPRGWPNAFAPAGTAAANAHATWDTLWNGNLSGSYNTVRPRFTNAAVQDQFRPNDKLLINAGIRYDDFTYLLPDSVTPATQFYANMLANYTCIFAATDQVLTLKLLPGVPPPAETQYVNGDCDQAVAQLRPGAPNKGWVHPNGTMQDGIKAPNFTAVSPSSFTLTYWDPRFSGTYAVNPNTVIRAAAGRFTQPPIAASLQYLSLSGNETSVWTPSMNLGFFSPFHPVPGVSAAQYDVSWEQRLKGTDMSFKVTPYFTWVNDWQQYSFVGPGFTTQIPVGINRDEGVEFQFQKGDMTRNGLSWTFAFTYTDSKIKFQNVPLATGPVVPNQIDALNAAISQYNELTRAGGGSPCYQAGFAVRCAERDGKKVAGFDTILNPYYNRPAQPLLDPSGWYNPYVLQIAPNQNGILASYISPYASALVLNWKHDKFAITPSFNFQTGGFYGSPLDTEGLDPRTCILNSRSTGITRVSPKTNPLQCNYLDTEPEPGVSTFAYLYIPDPQVGTFLFDNYQQPSSLVGNLQMSYDVTPHLRLLLMGTTLFHACFGGTRTPWTAVYPAGNAICGYSPAGGSLNSGLYPSNFYNGTGINDYKANGARTPWTQSYLPSTYNNGAIGGAVAPINLYFSAQLKL